MSRSPAVRRPPALRLGARGLLPLAVLVALSACAERELVLPGTRISPRAVVSPEGPAIVDGGAVTSTTLSLAAPRSFDWPQRAGNAQHLIGHAALPGGTTRIWSASIGQPSGKRHRITADPVVAGGRVFTLDSLARVTATALSGGTAWSANLVPATERGDSASGGGLAYDGGRVFATTGYGELVALDAASGGVIWGQRVDSPIGGAPTVAGGTVYATARNGTGWAVRASDGKDLWTAAGIPSQSGVSGVAAP